MKRGARAILSTEHCLLSTSSANTRNSEVTTFGLVGRLSPMKDHTTFLKAAALVPNARFVIVGSGDETYAQQMRDLATSLGVHATWLPAQSDMPSVYATLDCLVNSSAFGEGFSNVIGEAMACGVPCIASDVGDSAWIIGNPAQIFPAGDHEALAKCMLEFAKQSSPLAPREEHGALRRDFVIERRKREVLAGVLSSSCGARWLVSTLSAHSCIN